MNSFPTFVLASGNAHKLRELRCMLEIDENQLKSAKDFPEIPEPIENADSFIGNALIKARAYAEATGLWAIADDSGLEVDALNGEPGIYSARYAGEEKNDEANNDKLLGKLVEGLPRTAHFTSAIALVAPDGREFTCIGICPGQIIYERRGNNGFGYDPLFLPNGYTQTFAELSGEEKNKFSHRSRSVAILKEKLMELFPEYKERILTNNVI